MAADGPGAGRLPCPCRARRTERPLLAAHRRIFSALAVTALTALAVLGTSGAPVARVTLIVIAAVAMAAVAVLQVIARSHRRRWSAHADWRSWPPGYDPWAGGGDPVAGQHEGSAYRPGYGFVPGHGRGPAPRDPARLRVSVSRRSKRAEGAP